MASAYRHARKEQGARERKGTRPVAHLLLGVSPEWVKEAGDLHDRDNPNLVKLAETARAWAESEMGGCFALRVDLDEAGGALVDVFCTPMVEQRIGRGRQLRKIATAPGGYNRLADKFGIHHRVSYRAVQTSWAKWCQENLDPRLKRGTPRWLSQREHVTPDDFRNAAIWESSVRR